MVNLPQAAVLSYAAYPLALRAGAPGGLGRNCTVQTHIKLSIKSNILFCDVMSVSTENFIQRACHNTKTIRAYF